MLFRSEIKKYFDVIKQHPQLISELYKILNLKTDYSIRQNIMNTISNQCEDINTSLNNIDCVLEESIHGHINAKRQIKRIIGQWITGENSGYCFGFEGPPGVGKTSLAKNGLANCLKDCNGIEDHSDLFQ